MDKVKAFYNKNKKIVITATIVLVLLIAVGIHFISQPIDDADMNVESQTEERADISKDDKQEDDAGSEHKPADTSNTNADKPLDNASVATPSSSSNASDSNGNSSTGVNQPANKPSHSHVWKDHIVAKRVWEPNIVEVPVYENKKVHGAQFYTFSGYNELGQEEWIANGPIYWFENGFTIDDLNDIIYNALLQSPDGVVDGVLYAHYANIQRYDKVQTGTTQEDHGTYKTENYVDFQYCDCGAIR